MTATAFPEQSQDLQGSQRTKKTQSEGIQDAFGWEGGCFQMYESAKDTFFYLFFYIENRSHPLLFDPQLISISS